MSGLPPVRIRPEDNYFVDSILSNVPVEYRDTIKADHASKYHADGQRVANLHLLDIKSITENKRLNLDWDDIQVLADYRANLCLQMTAENGVLFVESCGIEAHKSKNEKSVYLRLISPNWWRRKLFIKQRRDRELFAIQSGYVHKLASPYCSQVAFEQIRQQDEINQQLMAEIKLVSGDEEITLLDAWKSSTSNPYNRFVELVTRIKGFEEYASDRSHEASFLTITAPSKFHAYNHKGFKNPKYAGASPRDTHQHLMGVWQKIRAQFSKQDIEVYGLRIVEPHASATPHYHMVLFGTDSHLKQAHSIMADYFTQEDKAEINGKTDIRFKVENIDKSKGSAVGYVIKYLAKNIVSEAVNMKVGEDFETGTPTAETSHKVVAWARIWGIRQFTFFGGAGVTVWRELRRHKTEFDSSLLEQLRQHAHETEWNKYQSLMETLDVKPYQVEAFNASTGELVTNAYEEPISRMKGIQDDSGVHITRLKEWSVVMPSKAKTEDDKQVQDVVIKPECKHLIPRSMSNSPTEKDTPRSTCITKCNFLKNEAKS